MRAYFGLYVLAYSHALCLVCVCVGGWVGGAVGYSYAYPCAFNTIMVHPACPGPRMFQTFDFTVLDDTIHEGPETIVVTLSNPTGGVLIDTSKSLSTITIPANDVRAPRTWLPFAVSYVVASMSWPAIRHTAERIGLHWLMVDQKPFEHRFSLQLHARPAEVLASCRACAPACRDPLPLLPRKR